MCSLVFVEGVIFFPVDVRMFLKALNLKFVVHAGRDDLSQGVPARSSFRTVCKRPANPS